MVQLESLGPAAGHPGSANAPQLTKHARAGNLAPQPSLPGQRPPPADPCTRTPCPRSAGHGRAEWGAGCSAPAGWGEGAGGGGGVGPPRASTGERLQLRSPLIQLVLTPGAHSWGRAGRGPVGGHGVSEKAHSVLRASRTPVAMATWPSPSQGPPELRFPPASTRAWGWGLRKGAAGSGCRPCLSRPSSPGSGGPETSVLSSLPGLRGEPRPPRSSQTLRVCPHMPLSLPSSYSAASLHSPSPWKTKARNARRPVPCPFLPPPLE